MLLTTSIAGSTPGMVNTSIQSETITTITEGLLPSLLSSSSASLESNISLYLYSIFIIFFFIIIIIIIIIFVFFTIIIITFFLMIKRHFQGQQDWRSDNFPCSPARGCLATIVMTSTIIIIAIVIIIIIPNIIIILTIIIITRSLILNTPPLGRLPAGTTILPL